MELKRIILFGDNLIASSVMAEVQGFGLPLIQELAGRVDILVRGFPDYTTREISSLTPHICTLYPHVVLLGFGNTDSALPCQIQHVPVEEFKENLERIAGRIAEHGAWPVIITPTVPNEARIRCRDLKTTQSYALASRQVADAMQIEVVDLFHGMQLCDDWEKELLLNDGLSLSAKGHAMLAKMIGTVVQRLIPPGDMPRMVPAITDPVVNS